MTKKVNKIITKFLLMILTVVMTVGNLALVKAEDSYNNSNQLFIFREGVAGNKVSFYDNQYGYIFRNNQQAEFFQNQVLGEVYLDKIVLDKKDNFLAFFSDKKGEEFQSGGSIAWLEKVWEKDSAWQEVTFNKSNSNILLAIVDDFKKELEFDLISNKIEQLILFNKQFFVEDIDKSG